MKEVIESVQRTIEVHKWEAIDGTRFDCNEECEKYEKSAKCVIFAKYKDFLVKESSEYDIFGIGNSDCQIDIVNVSEKEAVDIIFQAYCFVRTWETSENRESVRKIISNAHKYDDLLLIHRGYELDDFYVIGGLESKLAEIRKKVKE